MGFVRLGLALLLALGAAGCFPDLSSFQKCESGACGGGGEGAAGPGSGAGSQSATTSSDTIATTTTTTSTSTTTMGSGGGAGGPCDLGATQHGAPGVLNPSTFVDHRCIDEREVTFGEYYEFWNDVLAWKADDEPSDVKTNCYWKTTQDDYKAHGSIAGNDYIWAGYSANKALYSPRAIQGVDWCDAKSYCLWAGKDLCGDLNGNAIVPNPGWQTNTEMYEACTQSATVAADCTVENSPSNVLACVEAENTSCGTGVHDLIGNVWEWENNCAANADPAKSDCWFRNGGCDSGTSFQCDYITPSTVHRDTKNEFVGFRCCWPGN